MSRPGKGCLPPRLSLLSLDSVAPDLLSALSSAPLLQCCALAPSPRSCKLWLQPIHSQHPTLVATRACTSMATPARPSSGWRWCGRPACFAQAAWAMPSSAARTWRWSRPRPSGPSAHATTFHNTFAWTDKPMATPGASVAGQPTQTPFAFGCVRPALSACRSHRKERLDKGRVARVDGMVFIDAQALLHA